MTEVDGVIQRLNKEQGEKGEIVVERLGNMKPLDVLPLPTGIFSLDSAIGVGGFPRGRVVEVYGPASHGKTTVALTAIAETQRVGGDAAFVDAENAFDPEYARALGVDTDKLIFSQPSSGEQGLEVVEELARAGVSLIVVDSITGLIPRAELDGEMGDAQMGLQARLMSQAMRKIAGAGGALAKSDSVILFTNQIRMKLGIMFGNPETTTGGRAVEFYASVRIRVSREEKIDEGDNKEVGIRVKAKVLKNKVAAPFREAHFNIFSGRCSCHPLGVDLFDDLVTAAEEAEIVKKSGTWYSYQGERLAQGRVGVSIYLRENPQIAKALREILSGKFNGRLREKI